jgi:phage terminase small subunit
MAQDAQHTTATVDLLDGQPTSVSGQGVIPGLQATMGCDAVSPKLSAKHEAFCWEYIATCGNGTQAYLRVYPGVTERTARVNASRLLTNADIKARVEEILQERRNRHALLQDKVIEYHRSVMMLDRFELLDPDTGRVKRLDDLPPEAREVIEIEQVSAKDGVRTLLKVPTRHSSAQELARVLGMNKESMELTGKDGGPVEHRHELSDEMLARIAMGA